MTTQKESYGSANYLQHERRMLAFYHGLSDHFFEWLARDIQRRSHGYPEAKMANGTIVVWRPFGFAVPVFAYPEADICLTVQKGKQNEAKILVTGLEGKAKPNIPVRVTYPDIQQKWEEKTNPQGRRNTCSLTDEQLTYLAVAVIGPSLSPNTIPLSLRARELLLQEPHHNHTELPAEDA